MEVVLIHPFQAIWSFWRHPYGSLILGVDAAGMGVDCSAIVFRRRRHIARVETPYGFDTVDTAGRVEQIIQHDQPTRLRTPGQSMRNMVSTDPLPGGCARPQCGCATDTSCFHKQSAS